MPSPAAAPTLLLYDGVCGLCHRLVQFLWRRDRHHRLRFAPLQGTTAAAILKRHGKSPDDLDTVYLVEGWQTPDERLHGHAVAALRAVQATGGAWGALAAAARRLPAAWLHWGYRQVARRRYRLFGRLDACPAVPPAQRDNFLP